MNEHKSKYIIIYHEDCWGWGVVVGAIVSDKERGPIKM